MIAAPKTKEEARIYQYGRIYDKRSYVEDRCAYEVWDNFTSYQCSRTNGHGTNGLYCKQHAKMVK